MDVVGVIGIGSNVVVLEVGLRRSTKGSTIAFDDVTGHAHVVGTRSPAQISVVAEAEGIPDDIAFDVGGS